MEVKNYNWVQDISKEHHTSWLKNAIESKTFIIDEPPLDEAASIDTGRGQGHLGH
jgi:hypothetical protein